MLRETGSPEIAETGNTWPGGAGSIQCPLSSLHRPLASFQDEPTALCLYCCGRSSSPTLIPAEPSPKHGLLQEPSLNPLGHPRSSTPLGEDTQGRAAAFPAAPPLPRLGQTRAILREETISSWPSPYCCCQGRAAVPEGSGGPRTASQLTTRRVRRQEGRRDAPDHARLQG